MAVKGLTALTLADWGKRVDPNGKVDKIIELLGQTNPILQDMPFVEGNLPTGHRTTIRSGLPSATWRLLNYGVQPSKSTTVQVTDSVGMLETYAEVDKSLADLNGNTAEFRLSEDSAFIEAMNQQIAQTLFYGERYSQTILDDSVDFVKLAEALGVEACRVTKPEEFGPALAHAVSLGKPYLIDCVIGSDDKVFPMVPAGKPIETVFDQDDLDK